MPVKIIAKIALVITIILAVQIAHGMSGGRGWEFMPLGTPEQIPLPHLEEQETGGEDTYQMLRAQAQEEPNPNIREILRRLAEKIEQEYPRASESSSSSYSSSSAILVGSKRKREDALDKGKEPEEEESQQPPHVKAPKKESREESEQEIQKLLKNEMTISVDQFTQTNLKALRRLDKVGVLTILPKVGGRISANLIQLIEHYFPNILSLGLARLPIGDDGFEALAGSDVAPRLKQLNVYESKITEQGFTSENINKFVSLESLNVDGNSIGDVGFEALADSRVAARLKQLNVGDYCGITQQGFTSKNLSKFISLEGLNVNDNGIGDNGFEALAGSDVAPRLRVLNVLDCVITEQGFTSESLDKFKRLEVLSINDSAELNEDTILAAMMHSNLCQTLQKFDGLSEEAIAQFEAVCSVKSR